MAVPGQQPDPHRRQEGAAGAAPTITSGAALIEVHRVGPVLQTGCRPLWAVMSIYEKCHRRSNAMPTVLRVHRESQRSAQKGC